MEPACLSPEIKQVLEKVTNCTSQLYNIRHLQANTYVHKSIQSSNFINTANGYLFFQTAANYWKGHSIDKLAEDINSVATDFFNIVEECYDSRQALFPALDFLLSHAKKSLGNQDAGLLAVEATYKGTDVVVNAIDGLKNKIYLLEDSLLNCKNELDLSHDFKIVEYLLESQTQKLVPEQIGITQYALDYTFSFYYSFCRCLTGQWNWQDKIGDFGKGSIHIGLLPFRSPIYDSLEFMKNNGINVVVCVTKSFENNSGTFQIPLKPLDYQQNDIDLLQMPADDFLTLPDDDLITIAFYMRGKLQEGKKLYVHCKAGRGRSAQAVIAYLVIFEGMTVQQALLFVQTQRPQVSLGQARLATLQRIADKYSTIESEDFELI